MLVPKVWLDLYLGIGGLAAGLAVASGVFTVFTAVGLVPRFADRFNAANHILLFENMIILGVFIGGFYSIYEPFVFMLREKVMSWICEQKYISDRLVSIMKCMMVGGYGFFTGCYVSCLALSIAEIFDALPIMTRRMKLKKGIGLVLLMLAFGKLVGSLYYAWHGFFDGLS